MRLDARLGVMPDGRAAVRLGKRGSRCLVDAQIHSVLVDRGDLLGRHEAPAPIGPDHDPVEDVELGRSDDVVDLSDQRAAGGVHRHVLLSTS